MWGSGTRAALVAVDAFVALSAVGGGSALAAGLERDWFAPGLLVGTPFTGYAVPGLLLAGAVGGSAAVAAVAALQAWPAGARASVPAGIILMGWIAGETLLLNQPNGPTPIEIGYFATGALMAALGLLAGRPRCRAARHAHRKGGERP